MDVDIDRVKNIDPLQIDRVSNISPFQIDRVEGIERIRVGPVAAHIKEVNHIDPLSIDALHVNEIRNIDPINVNRFNVTHLPTVNMSVRQLPAVDMNIRRLPAVSVGTHQNFDIPSNYTLRARFLGIEFFRVRLCGGTTVVPRERYRREEARTENQSFPSPATAGNPAIPCVCRQESATVRIFSPHGQPCSQHHLGQRRSARVASLRVGDQRRTCRVGNVSALQNRGGSLHVGLPAMHFSVAGAGSSGSHVGSTVSSGG